MGTKLVLGFGSTANQALVHQNRSLSLETECFGSTANQALVHLDTTLQDHGIVSEVPQTKQ